MAEIPDEVWGNLYGEGKLSDGPPSVETLDLDAYLAQADSTLQALLEHAGIRGVGEPIEAARLSFPSGVTATVAVTTGPGGRLGIVVSDPEVPAGGYFTTFDADGVLEISTPDFLVRFVPGGETVEEWNAHSSCKTSHCIEAAVSRLMDDFWFLFLPGVFGIAYTCPPCDADYSNPAEEAAGEVACIACAMSCVAFLLPLIPVVGASVEECVFNDPCNWCMDDGCGSDELSRVCTYDTYDRSPGNNYVLLETGIEYYCSDPDEYQRCESRPVNRLIEGCPYGCDGDDACAGQPPTCDPAACHQVIGPMGDPYCMPASNSVWQDYEERNCLPLSGGGKSCQGEIVPHAEMECPAGCLAGVCASTSSVMLEVRAPGREGCVGCWVRLRGAGGTLEAMTNYDSRVTFEAVPEGEYSIEYGCGAESLGPHSPADLYPGIPAQWFTAENPASLTTLAGGVTEVLLGFCYSPACSAAGSPKAFAQDLPAAVADTRRMIIEAAEACDYEALAALAGTGETYFAYSLGEAGPPAAYWQSLEEGGAEPLRMMVVTLLMPVESAAVGGTEDAYYLWSDGAGGMTPYRAGISADGEWLFFLPDD